MAQVVDIAQEETTGSDLSTEIPPTWVLVGLETALEEVRAEASGRVENEEVSSTAATSSYVAVGWGASV